MKKVFLLLLLCCSINVFAQTTGSYSLSRWIGTFTSIEGLPGTVSTSLISKDDTTQTNILIGFTFSYCTVDYTQLSACSNGWLSLTNSAVWAYPSFDNELASHMFSIGGGVGFLMPYWDDLSGTITSSPTATAYYRTSGTSPNRVFTFQWGTPATQWHSYLGFGDATFQVKLYETSGVIEFVYGPGNYSLKTATIGIANSTSDFRVLPDDVMAMVPSSAWYYHIDTTPPVNTVLEWAPPCPSPPPASTGTFTVCEGSVTTLSNGTAGGTWQSSSVSVATVGSSTGDVTGVAGGVVNITYRVSPGCYDVAVVTVNPLPDTIAGGANACEGATKTYTCTSGGGSWSSSNTAVGTISTAGLFGGVSSGTTTLSYTFTSTGCARTLDVTVNSIPVISGNNWACLTDTTVLTSLIPGGTWSSSNTGRAIVDAYGNVTGVTLGSVIITYTAPSGCIDTMLMKVQTDCDVSVNNLAGGHFNMNVFPQPSNGDFYLTVPVGGSFTVTITDVFGKTYSTKSYEDLKTDRIHFSEPNRFPPGNYIVKLVAGEQMAVARLTIVK
jgi:hypothetical protein